MIEQGIHTRTDESFTKANGEYVTIGHGYVAVSEGFNQVRSSLETMVGRYPAKLGDAFGRYPRVLSKYSLNTPRCGEVQVLQHQTYIAYNNERPYNLVHQYVAVGNDCQPDFVCYPLAWMMAPIYDRVVDWRGVYVYQQPGMPAMQNFPMLPLCQLLPQFGMDLNAFENLLCTLFDAVKARQVYTVVLFDDARADYEALVRQLLVYIYILLPFSMRRACGFETWLTGSMDSALGEIYFASYRYWRQMGGKNYIYVDMENSLDVSECFLCYCSDLYHQKSGSIEQERYDDPSAPYRRFIHPWLQAIWEDASFQVLNRLNDEYWAPFDATVAGRECLSTDDVEYMIRYQQLREGRLPVGWEAFPAFCADYTARMGAMGDAAIAAALARSIQQEGVSPACLAAFLEMLRLGSAGEATMKVVAQQLAAYFRTHSIALDMIVPVMRLLERGLLTLDDSVWMTLCAGARPSDWTGIQALLRVAAGRLSPEGKYVISENVRRVAVERACALLPAPVVWDASARAAIELCAALSDADRDRFTATLVARMALSRRDISGVIPELVGRGKLLPQTARALCGRLAEEPARADCTVDAALAAGALLFDWLDAPEAAALYRRVLGDVAWPVSAHGALKLLEDVRALEARHGLDRALRGDVLRMALATPFPACLALIGPELSEPDFAELINTGLVGATLPPPFSREGVKALLSAIRTASPAVAGRLHDILQDHIQACAVPAEELYACVSTLGELPESARARHVRALIDRLVVVPDQVFFDAIADCVLDIQCDDALCEVIARKYEDAAQQGPVRASYVRSVASVAEYTRCPRLAELVALYYKKLDVNEGDAFDAVRAIAGLRREVRGVCEAVDDIAVEKLREIAASGALTPSGVEYLVRQALDFVGEAGAAALLEALRVPEERRQSFLQPMIEWAERGVLPAALLGVAARRWLPEGEISGLRLNLRQLAALDRQRQSGALPMDDGRFEALLACVQFQPQLLWEDMKTAAAMAEQADARTAEALLRRVEAHVRENGATLSDVAAYSACFAGTLPEAAARIRQAMLANVRTAPDVSRETTIQNMLARYGLDAVPGVSRLLEGEPFILDGEGLFSAIEKLGLSAERELMPSAVAALRTDVRAEAALDALLKRLGAHADWSTFILPKARLAAEALSLPALFRCLRRGVAPEELVVRFAERLPEANANPGFGDTALLEAAKLLADGTVVDASARDAGQKRLLGWLDGGAEDGGAFMAALTALVGRLSPEVLAAADEALCRCLENPAFKLNRAETRVPEWYAALRRLRAPHGVHMSAAFLDYCGRAFYMDKEAVARDAAWLNALLEDDETREGAAACFSASLSARMAESVRNRGGIDTQRLLKLGGEIEDGRNRFNIVVRAAVQSPQAAACIYREIWTTWLSRIQDNRMESMKEAAIALMDWLLPFYRQLRTSQESEQFWEALMNRLPSKLRLTGSLSAFLACLLYGGLNCRQADEETTRRFFDELLPRLQDDDLLARTNRFDAMLPQVAVQDEEYGFLRPQFTRAMLWCAALSGRMLMRVFLSTGANDPDLRNLMRRLDFAQDEKKSALFVRWSAFMAGPRSARRALQPYEDCGLLAMCAAFAEVFSDPVEKLGLSFFLPGFDERTRERLCGALPEDPMQRRGLLGLLTLDQIRTSVKNPPSPRELMRRTAACFPAQLRDAVTVAMGESMQVVRNFSLTLIQNRAERQLRAADRPEKVLLWDRYAGYARFTLFCLNQDAACALVDVMFRTQQWELLDDLERSEEEPEEYGGGEQGGDARSYFACVNQYILDCGRRLRRQTGAVPKKLVNYVNRHAPAP